MNNTAAKWTIGWNARSPLSYREFLQAKEFEKSIRYTIDNQTQEIVANETDLADQHLTTVREGNELLVDLMTKNSQQLNDTLTQGVVILNDTIASGFTSLNKSLTFGFSELIAGVRLVNDQLSTLLQCATIPGQTWANEQFEKAKDAFRRELYQESLNYLDRSINGEAGNVGYPTEHPYHFLKGIIHLGSYRNSDAAIFDLKAAEKSFMSAARYARVDAPQESALFLYLAGYAAYCDRSLESALAHLNQAIDLVSSPNADFLFLRAKIRSALMKELFSGGVPTAQILTYLGFDVEYKGTFFKL